jgi:hypothetical protein
MEEPFDHFTLGVFAVARGLFRVVVETRVPWNQESVRQRNAEATVNGGLVPLGFAAARVLHSCGGYRLNTILDRTTSTSWQWPS